MAEMEEQSVQARGIPCPKCRSPLSDVVRTIRGVGSIRRRRQCARCGGEWTTREASETEGEPVQAH